MKILKNIFMIILIFGFFILLANTNPTKEDFAEWNAVRITQNSEEELQTLLKPLTKPVTKLSTSRKDYTVFSIFTIKILNKKANYLGILGQFIQLGEMSVDDE